MPFNFYDTHTLLMAVQQLTPAATFLRDRYFPTNDASDIFATDDVLVEFRDGSKKLAPFVAPRKGGVTVLRAGYNMERYTPPFVAPRRVLTLDELRKRGFGEALYSQLTPEQRQQTLILRDADELGELITNREEAMAAETMLTNGCVMKHIADDVDKADEMDAQQKKEYIYSKLNRPVRVCGMVRNEGEPGGGPFLAYNQDGTVSPQILESTQIDPANKEAQKMLKEATHFNPVDLAVATRDWKGNRFDLPAYVDRNTGFISQKSREGVEIKALELPGLWNGAMSDWNTIFIEVPAETFNPVKTVNDLLRDAHQPLI